MINDLWCDLKCRFAEFGHKVGAHTDHRRWAARRQCDLGWRAQDAQGLEVWQYAALPEDGLRLRLQMVGVGNASQPMNATHDAARHLSAHES